MAVVFLLALLAPYSLGCAPVSPGTNGTSTTSAKGTFSMKINPPAAWTTAAAPKPPQQLSAAKVQPAINTQIEQAVKSLFYDAAKPVDTVNVTVNAHPTELDTITIEDLPNCTPNTGYIADNFADPTTIIGKCGTVTNTAVDFEVEITGTFDTAGLEVTTGMWDALAVSLQNKLSMAPYNLRFKELLKITPTTTSE